jgi:hypothetical protein
MGTMTNGDEWGKVRAILVGGHRDLYLRNADFHRAVDRLTHILMPLAERRALAYHSDHLVDALAEHSVVAGAQRLVREGFQPGELASR